MLISFGAILNKDKSLDEMKKFCAEYVARLDKPAKKERSQVAKSLKSLGKILQETEVEQKEITIETIGVKDTNRGEEVRVALRKNKGVLLGLREEEDDE